MRCRGANSTATSPSSLITSAAAWCGTAGAGAAAADEFFAELDPELADDPPAPDSQNPETTAIQVQAPAATPDARPEPGPRAGRRRARRQAPGDLDAHGPRIRHPDKNGNLPRTPAAFTCRPLDDHGLCHIVLARPDRPASDAVRVPRATGSPPASFPPRLAATQLPLACLGIISSTGDFHPQAAAHAGRTQKRPANADLFPFSPFPSSGGGIRTRDLRVMRVASAGCASLPGVLASIRHEAEGGVAGPRIWGCVMVSAESWTFWRPGIAGSGRSGALGRAFGRGFARAGARVAAVGRVAVLWARGGGVRRVRGDLRGA